MAELFERHKPPIYAYVFRSTGHAARSEDIVSTVFLEVWRNRTVEVAEGKVFSWLYGIATNVMRTERRSLRRHRDAVARMAAVDAEPSFVDSSVERIDDEQRVQAMLERVRALPRHEREPVVLCWWSGLTYEQAADALQVPVGTIKSRLSRARARLLATGIDTSRGIGAGRLLPQAQIKGDHHEA